MSESPAARLASPPWAVEAATAAVVDALASGGAAPRFVGGCVRDTLLGRPIGDIDIATPATPERVIELLDCAGIKTVPTGLQHGTITAVVPPRHFEITTLRRDVETFGRRARVAFDADWRADAERRDFTMNALFLDPAGGVWDYVGGLPDLRARRVRFVGDPGTRIREDVLRLLRFYRFHAQLGAGDPDEAGRAACRALASLLPTLSGERVAAELLKLLAAAGAVRTLRVMAADGVLAVILPEARRLELLAALVPLEPTPDPERRLAALLEPSRAAALAVSERLRLSNAQRDRLAALAEPAAPPNLADDERGQRRALYRLGGRIYRDLVLLRAAEHGADPSRLLALARSWNAPAFPLGGEDVKRLGFDEGPEVGRLLAAVRAWWEEGDFTADRAACLARLAALAGRQG